MAAIPPAAAPSPAATRNVCADPSTRYESVCHAVDVAGKTYRYLLFRAARKTSRTMIFDGGGPGVSNLSDIDARYEQTAADADRRGFNLLVLDEPWVMARYEPACQAAMTSFYRESTQRYPRPASPGVVTAVRQGCLNGDATSTAESYRSAVDRIEKSEGVTVARLEGYSFASVRAAYLGATRPGLVVAVGSPFPVGASADAFYRAEGSAAGTARRLVTSADLAADSAQVYYATTGTDPKDIDVATAARGLWQVTSTGDMSLSRAGYYAEICPALRGWNGLLGGERKAGSAVTALASLHAPCAGETGSEGLRLPPRTCFTVLANDPNSPWLPSPVTRGADVTTVRTGEHGKVKIPGCQ
ncbi:hypothetical protein KOI35_40925 [Actinoplanes bogorensis]|uniref:Uncharacterized protein n=1 Tax=Paractinoplanes bogorensis TaxID=1610840 RepID=A0ABS5Z2G6_9ACTN|nr:hypothetical protein [Actinoplanes bogorensis]MBU2669894.1 hypothetical protein [Actinoplanes bogorensis]